MTINLREWMGSRAMALGAATVLMAPILAGCGSSGDTRSGANLPPVDDYAGQRAQSLPAPEQKKKGMSTTTKVALLAGAAALYYMYNKNKQKRDQGDKSQPQYYLSKNGRVYYRDSSGRAHYVTPPAQGIQVPWQEAQQYQEFQGYNNQSQGRTLAGIGSG